MLKEGYQYMEQAPWLAFAPGAAMFLTVLAFNLLGASTGFNAGAGQALDSFNANGGGNFDAITGVVPEPGTWALMILGFGGAGAMLRRRRTTAATA